MRNVSVEGALKRVTENPEPGTDVTLDIPAHELIARTLFDIAASPDARVPGSLNRSTRAQKLILNRLVGTRRPGTHPVARGYETLTYIDMTGKAEDE